MWRTWSALSACLLSGRSEAPRGGGPTRKRTRGGGIALGEAAQQLDEAPGEPDAETELRMQPGPSTSGRDTDSPRVAVGAVALSPQLSPEASGRPPSAASPGAGPISPASPRDRGDQLQPQPPRSPQSPAGAGPLAGGRSLKGARMGSGGVRFAAPPGLGDDSAAAGSDTALAAAGGGGGDGGETTPDWRPSRVRLLLPTDPGAGASGRGGGGSDAEATPKSALRSSLRSRSTASAAAGIGDGGSRAVSQLAALLLSRQVDYRAELEELIETHGSAFPQPLLEQMLRCNGLVLPRRRLRAIVTLYRVGEEEEADGEGQGVGKEGGKVRASEEGGTSDGGDGDGGGGKIDGVALLKDLDRAAFRRLALGAVGGSGRLAGGGESPGAPGSGHAGAPTAANSRKHLLTGGQLGDKARILQLVAARLAEDESLKIRAGSNGEGLSPEHLQEVVRQIDLTNIAVPVGTRAPYVPSTEDPDSFQVPVWSLRAMHLRKQQRDRLLGDNDPALRQLGQAGREALRKRITRRSIFQQEEIIANAVVAAARAAVAPSARLAENTIQLAGASRASSLQRAGSRNSSPLRRSATSIPAGAADASACPAASAATTAVTVTAAVAAAVNLVEQSGGNGGKGEGGGGGEQPPDEFREPSGERAEPAAVGSLRPPLSVDVIASCSSSGSAPATSRPTAPAASGGTEVCGDRGGDSAGLRSASPLPLHLGGASPADEAVTDAVDDDVGIIRGGGFGSYSPLTVRPGTGARCGGGDVDDAASGGGGGGGGGSGSGGGGSERSSIVPSAVSPPGLALMQVSSRKTLRTSDGGMVILPVVVATSPGATTPLAPAQQVSVSQPAAPALRPGSDVEELWGLLGGNPGGKDVGGGVGVRGGGCGEAWAQRDGGQGGSYSRSGTRTLTSSSAAEGLVTQGPTGAAPAARSGTGGGAATDGLEAAAPAASQQLLLPPRVLESATRQRLLGWGVSSAVNSSANGTPSLRALPVGCCESVPGFEDEALADLPPYDPDKGTELPGQCTPSEWPAAPPRPATPAVVGATGLS